MVNPKEETPRFDVEREILKNNLETVVVQSFNVVDGKTGEVVVRGMVDKVLANQVAVAMNHLTTKIEYEFWQELRRG